MADRQNISHGVMPEQLVNKLRDATTANPGSDFVVIQKLRQGEPAQVWSTGDQEQTQSLFRETYDSSFSREPATT
jgi:hypothetical protein